MLRLGGHLVAAGNFADTETALGALVIQRQLFELFDDTIARLFDGGADLIKRQGLIGDIDDGFEHSLELRVFHAECGRGGLLRAASSSASTTGAESISS